MSETTNRQAYVMLTKANNDVLISGDIYLVNGKLETAYRSHGCTVEEGLIAFRPIATPEQTDKLTVEQRVTALELRLNAQPAEQTSETCKWKRGDSNDWANSPHDGIERDIGWMGLCPTCGLRIEVVE
jgi:hypothetical protein